MNKSFRRSFLLLVLSIVVCCSVLVSDSWFNPAQRTFARTPMQTASNSEQSAVEQAARQSLDNGVTVRSRIVKTAISGNFALVSWVQGETGGTALLKKNGSTWQMVTSGGGLIGVQDLVQNGVPQATAETLLTGIDPNWRNYATP